MCLVAAGDTPLRSLEPVAATRPGEIVDWAYVVSCLREAAKGERGDDWDCEGCAAWADLIEALTRPAGLEPVIDPTERRSLAAPLPVECL